MNLFNASETADNIVGFIKKSFANAGFSKCVIGVSGGIDSALVLKLSILSLGTENIYPVILPYGPLSTRATLDALELVQNWKIPLNNTYRFDIKPAVDAITLKANFMTDLRRGNIMARMRMIVLYDQAKYRNALVVGTENKSEQMLGYFTRFGDEASDIEPIRHLYKTQVYELAKYLSIPKNILEKPPSADLWFEQTDEKELGFSYKEADEILTLAVDEKKTSLEIISSGFDTKIVEAVLKRMRANQFKHLLPFTNMR